MAIMKQVFKDKYYLYLCIFFFNSQNAPTKGASKLKIITGKPLPFSCKRTFENSIFLFIVAAISVKKEGSLSYFVDNVLRKIRILFFLLINSRIIATVAFKIPQIISN